MLELFIIKFEVHPAYWSFQERQQRGRFPQNTVKTCEKKKKKNSITVGR